MDSWEHLKARAREEQAVVEGLLRELHVVSRDLDERTARVLLEIEREIDAKIASISALGFKMAEDARGNPSRTAQVHRLREFAGVWRAEVARVKEAVERDVARAQILGKTRNTGGLPSEEHLFKEKSQLLGAIGGAEQSVSLASEAQRIIRDQTRRTLAATEKLGTVAAKFPGVNALVKKIKNKQFRDELILAFVIAACLFWLFYKLLLARCLLLRVGKITLEMPPSPTKGKGGKPADPQPVARPWPKKG